MGPVIPSREELERLEREATPAPWHWDDNEQHIAAAPEHRNWSGESVLGGAPCGHENSHLMASENDVALVVAMRNALPTLLARSRLLDELMLELEQLKLGP